MLLKKYENRKISKNFDATLNFVSAYFYEKLGRTFDSIELMVHPDIVEGHLVDVLNRRNFSCREYRGVTIIKRGGEV